MALEQVVDATEGNYWDTNPHLRYLVERTIHPDIREEVILILDNVGRDSARKIKPYASLSDAEGCRLEVFTEEGTGKTYNDVIFPVHTARILNFAREQGLFGVTIPEEYGGMGLPHLVDGAIMTMMSQADPALFTTPVVTVGSAEVLFHFAPKHLKQKYIPLLCSTEENGFTGAMLLTESGAGSDVGAAKLSAVKGEGDYYLLTGQKIFITNPGADVNIVLARQAGAPSGTAGLSLFLVPKTIDEKRNDYNVAKLEEKLGIHSSPTGVVDFNGAKGYLLGDAGEGFKQMLYLMNRSRLAIGCQGIGIAKRSYDESLEYAGDRKQFRVELEKMPLMQEQLVDLKIEIEAATSMIFNAYKFLDEFFILDAKKKNEGSLNSEESAKLVKYEKLVRILTPLSKYRGSELGVSASYQAVNHLGGNGFTKEYPVEKLLRDSIIAPIYEGTNNIQALDVVIRAIAKEKCLDFLITEVNQNLGKVTEESLEASSKLVTEAAQNVIGYIGQIIKSKNPESVAQSQSRKLVEYLINVYEASLMLEEAQHLIDTKQDYRKAVTAMIYADKHFSGKIISTEGLSQTYFQSIAHSQRLDALYPLKQ